MGAKPKPPTGDPKLDARRESSRRSAAKVRANETPERRKARLDEARGRSGARAKANPEENRARVKAWRISNPEGRRKQVVDEIARIAALRKSDPLKFKDLLLRRKFGITLAEYDRMHQQQDGLCAICRRPERAVHARTGRLKSLAVDHNHTTGKIRGLLCRELFAENAAALASAIAYLANYA